MTTTTAHYTAPPADATHDRWLRRAVEGADARELRHLRAAYVAAARDAASTPQARLARWLRGPR